MALYDPNEFPVETKVGADFTLADVLAWARTKPAEEAYCNVDVNGCALAQFLIGTGRSIRPSCSGFNADGMAWNDTQGAVHYLTKRDIYDAAVHSFPLNFGGFVKRLEALAQ